MKRKVLIIIVIVLSVLILAIAGVVLANYLISQNRPVAIRVTSISHKNEYYVGEQLDTSGLIVSLYSEKKELRELDESEYVVEGFDSSKAGSVTLTVRYGEFTTQYTVTVKELPPEKPSYLSLEIYIMPTKTVYNIGEKLNVDGGALKINYTDGTYDIVHLMPLMTYGFSSDVAGTVTVNVKYLNMYTSFEVTIVDSEQSN